MGDAEYVRLWQNVAVGLEFQQSSIFKLTRRPPFRRPRPSRTCQPAPLGRVLFGLPEPHTASRIDQMVPLEPG